MKLLSIWIFAGLILIAADCAFAEASIEGHVQLLKGPSVDVINKRYQMNGEQAVIAPDPPSAVVYLEGKFPSPTAPRAQLVQKNFDFIPRLLPILIGTTVEFPNEDNTYHSLFSFSKPKRFDLGRYRGDEQPIPSQLFDHPGAVVIHCDIHEHMRAIILVLETPYFQKTDADGNYRITGLPEGQYQFKAWLNDKTILEKQVDLKDGGTLHVDFP